MVLWGSITCHSGIQGRLILLIPLSLPSVRCDQASNEDEGLNVPVDQIDLFLIEIGNVSLDGITAALCLQGIMGQVNFELVMAAQ